MRREHEEGVGVVDALLETLILIKETQYNLRVFRISEGRPPLRRIEGDLLSCNLIRK